MIRTSIDTFSSDDHQSIKSVWIAALLALSFTAVSCSSPTVRQLTGPLERTPMVRLLIDPTELAKNTAETLRTENLMDAYRRNPGEAYRILGARYAEEPTEARRQALVELASDTGDRYSKSAPGAAMGHYLEAARFSHDAALGAATTDGESVDATLYAYSVARLAMMVHEQRINLDRPRYVEGGLGRYELVRSREPDAVSPLAFTRIWPADWLEFKGIDLKRITQKGFGAAMVGHLQATPARQKANPFMPGAGFGFALNASMRFDNSRATLALQNLMEDAETQIEGNTVPLAADFTAPLVFRYYEERKQGLNKLMATLRPSKYASAIGMYAIQPFEKDRTTLVLVHGLLATAEGWLPLLNLLRQDPVIREEYQIVLFNYPTGTPIARNAYELRQWLAKYRDHFDPERNLPEMRSMVILGHSMGGILSNMQIRSSGDRLTKLIFKTSLDDLNVDPEELAEFEAMQVFAANPDIDRAILMATPHRGSRMATNWIGRVGAWLIRLPFDIVDTVLGDVEIVDNLTDLGQELSKRPRNSITSLRPDNPVLPEVLKMPVTHDATIHSIIAQANVNAPVERGTDRVVGYWSSHLDEAVSEKIVYGTNHSSVVKADEALEEIWRILELHLEE